MLRFDAHAAAVEREVFQVTFGSRPSLQQSYGVTDSVNFIVEAPHGDIVVAGNGASSYTDTGSRTKPMIARIDRAGKVLWRRIYADLPDHDILAFAGKDNEQFILFRQRNENRSGRLGRTETVSLRRVGSDGLMSGILGSIDGVQAYDATPVIETELQRFVLAGIDAQGMTYDRPGQQRDVRLHEIDLHGNVRRMPLQEGIKGLRHLRHIGGGEFVFLRMESFYTAPQEIARVHADGQVEQIIEWNDPIQTPAHVVATKNRFFLIYRIDVTEKKYRILAHGIDGNSLWHYDIEKVDRVFAATATRAGGLILSGSYEGNPLLFGVSPEGELQWTQRFRSAKANAGIVSIKELSDDWLALAGSTGPGNAAFSSTDSDALLVIAGPAGAGLSSYSGCLADAGEIERLRLELQSLTGIVVRREVLMSGRRPTPVEALPPLNEKVPPTEDCGTLSEQDLQGFLQEAVAEARALGLSKPSARVQIDVTLRPDNSLNSRGFKEMGRFDVGRMPRLEIEHGSAAPAMNYVAEEILPFTERFWLVFDQLQAAGRMWVGDMRMGSGPPGEPDFREVTIAAEQFVDTLNAQPAADRRAFVARFAAKPIVFSPDNDLLHVWGDRWVLVGKNRIDDIFEYVLRTLPAIESQIRTETETLQSKVAIKILKTDPNLPHSEYLEVLRSIVATLDGLSDDDVAILRNTFAQVEVGDRYMNDLGLSGYGRQVYMETVAAAHILSFIVENATELQSRQLR